MATPLTPKKDGSFETTSSCAINEPKTQAKTEPNQPLSITDLISADNLHLMLTYGNKELDTSTVAGFVHGSFLRSPAHEIARFRTLEAKLDLLSTACRLLDGNLIKYVLGFLKRTLDRELFAVVLAENDVARKHFVRLELELNDGSFDTFESLLALDPNGARSIGFQQLHSFTNQIHLLDTRIAICNRLASYEIFPDQDRVHFNDYVKLLEYGQKNNILSQDLAPIALLVNLCLEYVTKASTRHEQFAKLFGISRRQFQWAIFNVYCNQNCWSSVLNLLKREGHFRSAVSFNCNEFAPSKVIIQLAKHQAPIDIVRALLPLIETSSGTIKSLERNKCRLIAENYCKMKL